MTSSVVPWRLLGTSDLSAITAFIQQPFDAWCRNWFRGSTPTLGAAIAVAPGAVVRLDTGTTKCLSRGEIAAFLPPEQEGALAALGVAQARGMASSVALDLLHRLEQEIREDLLLRLTRTVNTTGEASITSEESLSRLRLNQGGVSLHVYVSDKPMYRLFIGLPALASVLIVQLQPTLETTLLADALAESCLETEVRLKGFSLPLAKFAALAVGDVITLDTRLDGIASLHLTATGSVLGEGHLCKRVHQLCLQLIDSSASASLNPLQ